MTDSKPSYSGTLKVIRRPVQQTYENEHDANQYKYSTIGYVGKKFLPKRTASIADTVVTRVPVVRKKNEILRKRRSTIAVNAIDIKIASNELKRMQPVLFAVKSVNSIDKIDKNTPICSNPCRNSMPGKCGKAFLITARKTVNFFPVLDLSDINKLSHQRKLKVRRNRVLSSERLFVSTENIDDSPVPKSNGPEFIANSSAEAHYIEMTDIKVK